MRMRLDDAVEHFFDDIVGVVQELLDVGAEASQRRGDLVVDLWPLRMLLIDLRYTIGIEDAPAGGGIGNEHTDIAAAKRSKDGRNLVETACNGDAHLDLLQQVKGDADRAVVQRPR